MSFLNRIMSPIIEHSVNAMEEEERQALFDRVIDRMLRDMSVDELIELLDRIMPGLLRQMTLQQKLKMFATLLPKIVNERDFNAIKKWIDAMPHDSFETRPSAAGVPPDAEFDPTPGP